jgi:hypothetical protein
VFVPLRLEPVASLAPPWASSGEAEAIDGTTANAASATNERHVASSLLFICINPFNDLFSPAVRVRQSCYPSFLEPTVIQTYMFLGVKSQLLSIPLFYAGGYVSTVELLQR